MITKEQFISTINSFKEFEDFCDKQRELGVDYIESPVWISIGKLFDNVIYSNFNDEASDFIMWWMFEDSKDVTIDGEEVTIDTAYHLWEYLKSQGYVE